MHRDATQQGTDGGRRHRRISRRDVGALGIGLGVAAITAAATDPGSARPRTVRTEHPFALGVASGDPLPAAVILWTRLVVDPTAPDGGLPPGPRRVDWQIDTTARFRSPVRAGSVTATRATAHCVKIDARGLRPGTDYYYRFRCDGHLSPVGRTRTAPAPHTTPDALTVAWASCQAWGDGYYVAYADMADRAPDVVLHLGDYIYEKPIPVGGGRHRGIPLPDSAHREAVTLDDYRERYALYRSDPDLQRAHRTSPFIVAMDDHEVDNNWAGLVDENGTDPRLFARRRAAAFQAWWEHTPARLPAPRAGAAILYRRFTFGTLATVDVLDTRQYRSDQVNGDVDTEQDAASADPARTLLGDGQERWLLRGFERRRTRWNVLAHQVPIADLARRRGTSRVVSMDGWSGYQAQRARVLDGARDRRLPNLVSIVGDIHRNVVSELRTEYRKPSPSVGIEFAGTSITSGADGEDSDDGDRALKQASHVLFGNAQRGYVTATVTDREFGAEFRTAETVGRPDARLGRRARITVAAAPPTVAPAVNVV